MILIINSASMDNATNFFDHIVLILLQKKRLNFLVPKMFYDMECNLLHLNIRDERKKIAIIVRTIHYILLLKRY